MAFPTTPTDGELYTNALGTVFKYTALDNKWNISSFTLTGATGIQGETGVAGSAGSQGETGLQGAQGPQGETGAQGVTGLVGAQGVTGTAGTQGETGIQGVTGLAGADGVTGTQGAQGATGTQGLNGDSGVTGVINISYDKGAFISPFTGLVGNFVIPHNYNIYAWELKGSTTGVVTTKVGRQTYDAYTPSANHNTLSGDTGPFLDKQLKNRNTNIGWTGLAGDSVSIYATGVTGVTSLDLALFYNKV